VRVATATRRDIPEKEGTAVSLNLAVVRGSCSSVPDVRELTSGRVIAVVQVTTRPDDGAAISVPVVLWDPPAWVEDLDEGDEVVAVGRVRRRFYQAGGAAASKVEIEADLLAKAGDKRRVGAALRRARDVLETLAG
jgi:single-strand DNA-binding protein